MNKPASFTDRKELWSQLKQQPQHWDMIIVGGGIIGAGVLREATRRGLKALLIEQRDFAWGTSSRSSKMVHGGLRYIAQGDIKLTKQSLQERERLLREAPGLIERMGYFFLLRKKKFPGRLVMNLLLSLYDRLAGIKDHRYLDKESLPAHFPGLNTDQLKGACYYTDTAVDDARLVLRVLQESIQAGGQVLNYAQATKLIKKPLSDDNGDKCVQGLVVKNIENDEQLSLKASVVINATGAWADRLRSDVIDEKRIRPLRGSHLVLPREKLPVEGTLGIFHPEDKRPVFIFPWEGATLIGTTDIDHRGDLDQEACITNSEVDYLLQIVAQYFPQHQLSRKDVISCYSGVRPVIGSDNGKDPSKERRTHAVWADKGLVTVSGGKLTTFRVTAIDTLEAAKPWLVDASSKTDIGDDQVFAQPPAPAKGQSIDKDRQRRMLGRYGSNFNHMLANTDKDEWQLIGQTQFCLAECRWAIKNESVVHLDDLLLRRTRLGLLLENGGKELFSSLENMFHQELGWCRERWEKEVSRYLDIWQKHYSLPPTQSAS